MLLTRLLNACHHFPGFVYIAARLIEATSTIEIDVRPRRGSRPRCSCCGKAGAGYDVLPVRRFEFIPIWGYAVQLLYGMRRVNCRTCGVKVEQVPWANGKHTLTRAYMLYLAHWARKLSWKETALSFRTTWDHVCQAVEYVVQWGLAHRELGPIRAIGVDEIAVGRGHKYLTLVYQIEAECVRLLWVGKERTTQSFEQFFTLIGQDLAAKIEFVCSDMWRPYLDLIAKHCTQCAEHPGPLPCRGQAQQGAGRGACRRSTPHGARGVRAGAEEKGLVLAQASREPHRQPAHESARIARLQPAQRPGLFAQGRVPAVLGLRLTGLGGQVPRRLVHPGNALAHRAGEEVRPHDPLTPRIAAELLSGQKGVLQRHRRGAEQQSQSHHEKSLRLS